MMVSGSMTALATEGESFTENSRGEEIVLEMSEDEFLDAGDGSEDASEETELFIEDAEDSEDAQEEIEIELEIPDPEESEEAPAEDPSEVSETVEDTIFPTGLDLSDTNFTLIEGNEHDEAEFEATYESKYINQNLPALRDQYPYGTCWAFASNSLMEINLMKTGIMKNPDLSELHLAYFTYNSVVDPLKGTEGDYISNRSSDLLDKGGSYIKAFDTYQKWTGAASESKVPYSNAKTALKSGLSTSLAYDDVAHVESLYMSNIDFDTFRSTKNVSYLDAIKKMVKEYGAVGISFGAVNSMQGVVNDKIYSQKYCSYYNPSKIDTNHAVVIVGWDDNFSKYDFATTAPGNGAFLIRNSWTTKGSTSNLDYTGYFWMSYYEPSIHPYVYAVKANTNKNYDNNYQYDGYMSDNLSAIRSGIKGANVFTAHASGGSKGETLKAVSFMSLAFNTSYTVQIYKNVKSTPGTGTLVSEATTSGTIPYAGYITVPLKKAVNLTAGTKFAVVVSLTSDGLAFDKSCSGSGYKVTANSGESYYYTGSSWQALDSNFKIKAYTNNVSSGGDDPSPTPEPEPEPEPDPDPTLKEVKLTKKELSDGRVQVQVSYTPSDYVPKSAVKWSSTDTTTATVDNSGIVTFKNYGYTYIKATVDGKTGELYLRNNLPDDYVKYTVDGDGTVHFQWNAVNRATEYILIRSVEYEQQQIAKITSNGQSTYTYTDDFYKNKDEYAGETAFYGFYAVINKNQFGGFFYFKLPSREKLQRVTVHESDRGAGWAQLFYITSPYDYVPISKKWFSSDTTVATIDQNGLVKFIDVGDVSVGLTIDGISGDLAYEVIPNVELEQSLGKVTVSWKKSPRAKGYKLYRATGDQELIYTATNKDNGSDVSLSFTDTYFYENPVSKDKKVNYILRIEASFGEESYRDYSYDVTVEPRGTDTDDSDGWGDVTDPDLQKYFGNPDEIPYDFWYVVNKQVIADYDTDVLKYSATFTGDKITFDDRIDVYYNNYKLIRKKDYKISYKGNVNANLAASGVPTVTISTSKISKTKRSFNFTIKQADFSGASIDSETVVPVTAGKKKLGSIKPKVSYKGKTLKAGKDYELIYRDKSKSVVEDPAKTVLNEAGEEYYISVKALEDGNFKVAELSTKVTVKVIASKQYVTAANFKLGNDSGKVLQFDFGDIGPNTDVKTLFRNKAFVFNKKAVLVYNKDYTVELVESDYTTVGIHKVRIIGKGEYCGSKTLTFKVLPYNIGEDPDGRITIKVNPAKYSSKGAIPGTVVTFKGLDGKTMELVKGVDYTISYKNNKKVAGKNAKKAPTVLIKGKGSFTGTAKENFDITK